MASNLVVARGGVEFVPPISLAFWRWTLVFLILLPFTYVSLKKNYKIIKKEYQKIFFLGATGCGVCGAFPFLAGQTTTVTNMVIIYTSSPIFIILISIIFFNEKINLTKIIGLITCLIGVFTIIIKGDINNMKLEISLFKFDSNSDYLPFYTKHFLKIKDEKNLLDILNTINKNEKDFFIEGQISNKNTILHDGLLKIFNIDLKNIEFLNTNFNSNNKFTFLIDKKFKVKNLVMESDIEINNSDYKIPINLENFFKIQNNIVKIKDHRIKSNFKNNNLIINGSGKIKLNEKIDWS